LAGFINIDGSFFFSLTRDIRGIISIGQHTKSLLLLNAIVKFLSFGILSKSKKNVKEITIAKLSHICILIEKLNKHFLYGAKYLNFIDFCKGIEIIKQKKHLIPEGKNQIKKLLM
jgi:hypothetical protein